MVTILPALWYRRFWAGNENRSPAHNRHHVLSGSVGAWAGMICSIFTLR